MMNMFNMLVIVGMVRYCSGGNGVGWDSLRMVDEFGIVIDMGFVLFVGDDERGRGRLMLVLFLSMVVEFGVFNEGGVDVLNGSFVLFILLLK